MQPPAIELESDAPNKQEQPFQIYILHLQGVRVVPISSQNSMDFILSAFYKILGEYQNGVTAAALYSPNGDRVRLETFYPPKRAKYTYRKEVN